MVFALLALATPSIGPPPNVCPLGPDSEFEDDDPPEFDFSPESDESPEGELPAGELPESPLAEVGVPAPVCCGPPGCAPNPPRPPCGPPRPPCGPPNPPCPPPKALPPLPICPAGVLCPGNTGPLFKLMSCWCRNFKSLSLCVAGSILTGSV